MYNDKNNNIKKVHKLVYDVKNREKDWEKSFEELNSYIIPIIRTIEKNYYLVDYEDNDWLQEGALVCFKACTTFNSNLGSVFMSYFKLLFKNHVISLIRKQNSYKRKINSNVIYWDNISGQSKKVLINRNSDKYTLKELSLATSMSDLIYEFNDRELHYFGKCLQKGLYDDEKFSNSTKRSVKKTVRKFLKDI